MCIHLQAQTCASSESEQGLCAKGVTAWFCSPQHPQRYHTESTGTVTGLPRLLTFSSKFQNLGKGDHSVVLIFINICLQLYSHLDVTCNTHPTMQTWTLECPSFLIIRWCLYKLLWLLQPITSILFLSFSFCYKTVPSLGSALISEQTRCLKHLMHRPLCGRVFKTVHKL